MELPQQGQPDQLPPHKLSNQTTPLASWCNATAPFPGDHGSNTNLLYVEEAKQQDDRTVNIVTIEGKNEKYLKTLLSFTDSA